MLNLCSNTNNALFFSSIDEIPVEIWADLDCEKNTYFHRDFLKSIEKSHTEILFSYIVLLDKNNQPEAFASLQVINFYLDNLNKDFDGFLKKIKNLGRKLHIIPNKKPLKLLISGNTFVSGEHGIFIKEDRDKKVIIKKIAKAILHFANANKKLKIDAFLLKDFINASLFITDELKDYNYHPFLVEPNMQLQIHDNWHNFEDYLASMKTKFRVKARRALKLSEGLKIEDVTIDNIDKQLPEMEKLYKKVADQADFNLSNFSLKAYKDLKQQFNKNYILKTYWLNGKIVGFISGLVNQDVLDAHFVGIDYELNREFAIYQRMLYDYTHIAIGLQLKTVNFGRTASEIKSSVGAVPQDLTMYLRHKKSITNKIVKLFLQKVQPTPFKQKLPFKTVKKHEK